MADVRRRDEPSLRNSALTHRRSHYIMIGTKHMRGERIFMDETSYTQDSMQDFFAPSKGRRIAILILVVVMAASVLGIVAIERKPLEEPVRLAKTLEKGTYCYLDIQLLSDWIIKVTGDDNYTYYEAMDPDQNWFIVSLDDDVANELAACFAAYQYFFYDDAPYAELPEPYRLYGVTGKIRSDDLPSLASYFDATQTEFTDYFGNGYFNEGARPSNDWEVALFTAGAFAFLFLLILLIQTGIVRGNYKKSDNRLYALGKIDDAAAEFTAMGNLRFERAKLVLSDNFIYAATGGIIAPYEDVAWIYKRVQRSYGVAVATTLHAGLIDGRTVALAGVKVTDELLERTAAAILQKNPDLIVGYSLEKNKRYRALVKAYKQAQR